MPPPTHFSRHAAGSRHRGVALVVVLAFVVLLTGLMLAFFSRALSERQISNSSANEARVDIFAQGALATVIGDVQQEIAAGSTQVITTPAPGVTLFRPRTAAAAAPCLARVSGTDNPLNSVDLNLVKRSANSVPFYSGSSYDTGNYPPSKRAASCSSLSYSQNGRTISPARWNKPLLLPKATLASDTDFTPAGATAANGTNPATWSMAPDWVVVARDGTNPTTWSPTLITSGTNAAIGRFAYNVYDEGGLLDANVAGYPTDPTVAAPAGNYPAYKKALAFADLKQLPGITDLPTTGSPNRQEQVIRTLAGWRNFASAAIDSTAAAPAAGAPITGKVNVLPGYNWTSTNVLNYLNFAELNGAGFLRTANSVLVSNQSDRFFGSRQQLMNLLLGSIADQSANGTAERADLQNALQYLGTFSRDLNQPSYIRLQSTNASSTLDYNSTIPTILAPASGGNDANSGDDKINPSFPLIRVTTSFTRDAGTTAQVGEPLVKKRFPLIYLAWLTYLGPSNAPAAAAAQPPLLAVGVPQSIISQGTAANIQAYFGLVWQTLPTGGMGWKYVHGANGTNGPIMTLSKVAALTGNKAREPDFFELLKASVNAGSIAKPYAAPGGSALDPAGYQAQRDDSVDGAIIQMGANIVDQFDPDSYPTCIAFDDGSLFGASSAKQVYRGIEDLPYIYRVREGKVMISDSVPAQNTLPQVAATQPANFSPGSGVVLQEPEVWNPHGWSATATPSLGARPTNFQLTAVSSDPNGVSTSTVQPDVQWRMNTVSGPAIVRSSPGTSPAAALNSSLFFQIPAGRLDLFREPTLLLKANVPTGCQLSGGTTISALYPAAQYTANGAMDDKNYLGIVIGTVPMAWYGTGSGSIPANGITAGNPATAQPGTIPAGYVYYQNLVNGITWRLGYQDPSNPNNYITYDEKYARLSAASSYNTPTYAGALPAQYTWYGNANGTANNNIGSEIAQVCFDPRTSRFGMILTGRNGVRANSAMDGPISSRNAYSTESPKRAWGVGWSAKLPASGVYNSVDLANAAAQNALLTARPDECQGFCFSTYDGIALGYGYNTGPTAGGWYPAPVATTTVGASYGSTAIIRPGLYAQNNPDVANSANVHRFDGDDQGLGAPGNAFYGDADGVVRRAMSAFVPVPSGGQPATPPAAGQPSGLPLEPATTFSGGTATPNTTTNEYASRPIVLNRPFRSVAELGYVFSGTPWKNLDFSTPESGDVELLDAFCINDTDDAQGLVAGKVDLNTRQGPILKAILAGAYKDELNVAVSTLAPPLTPMEADTIGTSSTLGVPAWTSNTTDPTKGPLTNIGDLVGRWQASTPISSTNVINGAQSYSGYIGTGLSSALTSDPDKRVARFREAAVRALSANGQARVWNVMIDLVAQIGRYPINAGSLDKFLVEGEQRYWLHVAIDRQTGRVIDKQLELVKE